MGVGKSTFYVLMLAYLSKKHVYLVGPNIEVANGLFLSLINTLRAMENIP